MQIISITIHNFRSISESQFFLDDYSLLIGANNSGKSNVMDALRIFYEKGLKYEHTRDFPKFETSDNDSWIEVKYRLNNDEYSNLKEEWRGSENKLKVRKYFETKEKDSDGKSKLGIYAYDQQGKIANEHFYGAKNVQQGKLGEIVFIPAASKLDEHTKLTGPSPLRDLLNDILKKLVKTSGSFRKLTTEFETFAKGIKSEETDEERSLSGLEQDITTDIKEWGAKFVLEINPVNEADIVKNLVSYKIIDSTLHEKMEASQFGQGFQRHLIFTLIRTAAKYQAPSAFSKKKEFKPDLTILLFEEPEAFLHPIQQNILCSSLKTIGNTEGQQVVISSHSPNFVSRNSDDIPSIIRLCREGDRTCTGQIKDNVLKSIFTENQQINNMFSGTSYEASIDDLKEEMEAVKYFLWLNSERCGMFFSRIVLLVEGPTERMLINYLIDTGQLDMPKGGVFILDCLGKFNIHRFMNLLGPLKIQHSILYDGDEGKPPHDQISQLIEDAKNNYTVAIDTFQDDVEAFLGIVKSNRPHRKPQHVMLKLKEGCISNEKLTEFAKKVRSLYST